MDDPGNLGAKWSAVKGNLGVSGRIAVAALARLETVVARRHESNRRGFLLARGFGAGECVTYRWGMLEGRHQAPPLFYPEPPSPEMV